MRFVYFNMFQLKRSFSEFALWTTVDPVTVAGAVRRAVRTSLETVPVRDIRTLAEQVDASIVPERLIALLSGLFGVLGALLAAIGTYGLVAYSVTRRVNEIGIRMALGATQTAIFRTVLGEALAIACAGLLVGVPVAQWAQRLAASLIPDLPAKSVSPIAFGAVMLIVIALVAAYVPAHRASRVDPMEALRHE